MIAVAPLLASFLLPANLEEAAAPARRQNVLFILADDLGYGDLGCYGHPRLRTPHLDRLAAEGARLTQFYVTSPVCTPSRASFLTGILPQRLGIHHADLPERLPRHALPLGAETAAELLRDAGWRTGLFGKWHLGEPPATGMPREHGFDRFFGGLGGRPSSSWLRFARHDDAYCIEDERAPARVPGNLTAATTDAALRFLDERGRQPFFLCVWYHAPHEPLSAAVEEASLYGDVADEAERVYLGTVSSLDRHAGRLLAKLEELGAAADTFVFFSSDNGPEVTGQRFSRGATGGLRGRKTQLWEGGIRVPALARWPGRIPAGSVVDAPASALDFVPTALALAGVASDGLPGAAERRRDGGIDLLPILAGGKPAAERVLFWEFHGAQRGGPASGALAVRRGRWKLHTEPGGARTELYDLAADPGETRDLAAAEPRAAAELRDLVLAWYAALPGEAPGGAAAPAAPATEEEAQRLAVYGDGPAPGAPFFERQAIFPVEPWHNHASSIVELANGDLLVCWYHGSGERQADDVVVLGARRARGAGEWSRPFLLADAPGFPDTNPILFVDPRGRLWLFWQTILANEWHTAIHRFKVSSDCLGDGPPRWEREDILLLKPGEEFREAVEEGIAALPPGAVPAGRRELADAWLARVRAQASDKLTRRLGWMTRVHPLVLDARRMLVPLYSDGYDFSLMAITDDWGRTWKASRPLVGGGNVQPSLVSRRDGAVAAYMRDNGPAPKRILHSESRDRGETWSPVVDTDLPNPGASVEVILLRDGRWLMAHNDTERGRQSFAVSLSADEGKTWPWTRHLEPREESPDVKLASGSYPSVIEARDGTIHVTYSYSLMGSTIVHARFNAAWVERRE